MSKTVAQTLIKHRGQVNPFGRTTEAVAEHARLTEALNQEARDNWDKPEWHREIAALLASSLDYGFTFENLWSEYFQVETVGEFDNIMLNEVRGLTAFYTARGGYIEESQLRNETWTLPRDTIGFHVSEMTDKLRANFAPTMERIVGLGEQRLDAEINRRIYSTLGAALPAGSPYEIVAATLTKPALDLAVRAVKDAIKPNGMGPIPVTIAGRAAVIDQISDLFGVGGFYPEALEEIRLQGRLGTYKGANVTQIVNYTDEDGFSYIPENELWVFGGTVGKFVMYGGLRVKTWEEDTVDYTHWRAAKDIGGLVHHPEQARVFRFTG